MIKTGSDFLIGPSQGLYAVATSSEARQAFAQTWDQTRVQPLANRLVQKAELRGTTEEIADASSPKLALYVIEDMVGAPAVEASVGYDLTGKQMEGELLDGGPRTHSLFVGIGGGAGFGAAGLSVVGEATGLTFELGSAAKVPVAPAPMTFRPNSVPTPEGYTRAYRAVSEAEYQDILASGQLRQGPNSLEGKWFADSIEGAQAHGNALYPSWGSDLPGGQT